MIYLQLFYEFFKTGLFAVGGGLATLPFLYDISARTGWFTTQDIADLVAVSESTPGPLGVNMASYVGFTTCGLAGGLVATLGLITPSVIVILIVARVLNRFREAAIVERVFTGLRPASVALISAAGIGIARIALLVPGVLAEKGLTPEILNLKGIGLAAVIWITYRKFAKHPVYYIAASAVIGILLKMG